VLADLPGRGGSNRTATPPDSRPRLSDPPPV